MAQAKTDRTRIDDATSKTAPPPWLLIVEEIFPQWRDRLGSSKDAKDYLEALLCDPETSSKRHRVDASGEEIFDIFLDAWFWQDRLVLEPDADGGDHYLAVNYGDPYLDYYGGRLKFFVRRLDVEGWERRYPELAPPAATTAGAEKRAIAYLVPLLKRHKDAMSKDKAREECKRFEISGAGFEDRVWPAAREQAGLERKAPAGRKPSEPKEIKQEADQILRPKPGKKSRS